MIIIVASKATSMNRTEITVKDGNKYFYTTSSYNAENPLGVVKATLKEYTLYKIGDTETLIGKLYKTEDGNWYDLPMSNSINSLLATFAKMAIDESEKAKTAIDTILQKFFFSPFNSLCQFFQVE
jgi:hypothetical protein